MTLERHTALFRDPSNSERRFVPLRLDDVQLPDVLKPFAYVDWRAGEEEEYLRLLKVCRPSTRGRTKKDKPKTRILQEEMSSLLRVTITPDGVWGLLGTERGPIELWNLLTQKRTSILSGHKETVVGLGITADGSWAASGSHDGRVHQWCLKKRKDAQNPRLIGSGANFANARDGVFEKHS